MITLPEKFKKSIINRYDKEGSKWLKNVGYLIQKYANQYQLEDIRVINNLSINLVLFAKTKKWGEVVLKIAPAGRTEISEVSALKSYPAQYAPICYEYNKEDEVMILELLSPGTPLALIKDREERIKIFSDIANHIMFQTKESQNFKIYEKRWKDKIAEIEKNKKEFLDIKEMITTAIEFYKEIKEQNLPQYVLHGDLQDKNILKAGNQWKAIDPHGIIAEKAFEAAPFILNEITYYNTDVKLLDNIILQIAKYFKEDKELIKKALCITIVEKIIWQRHSKFDMKVIPTYIDMCYYLMSKLKSL